MSSLENYNLKLSISESSLKELNRIKKRGGYKTHADLIKDALSLVRLIQDHSKEGYEHLILEHKNGKQVEPVLSSGIMIHKRKKKLNMIC